MRLYWDFQPNIINGRQVCIPRLTYIFSPIFFNANTRNDYFFPYIVFRTIIISIFFKETIHEQTLKLSSRQAL